MDISNPYRLYVGSLEITFTVPLNEYFTFFKDFLKFLIHLIHEI